MHRNEKVDLRLFVSLGFTRAPATDQRRWSGLARQGAADTTGLELSAGRRPSFNRRPAWHGQIDLGRSPRSGVFPWI